MRYFEVRIGADREDEGEMLVVEALDRDGAWVHSRVVEALIARAHRTGRTQRIQSCEVTHKWVNAYEVDRCYGGPEEGGWYYDSCECLASMPVRNSVEASQIESAMKAAIGWENERTRYSVIGGSDFETRVEAKRAQSERTEVPHYC